MQHALKTRLAAAAIALLAAACSDDTTSSATTAPSMTAATTATPPATDSPTSTTVAAVPFPARMGALTAGTTYNVGRLVLHRPFQMTATEGDQRGIAAAGRLWIFSDTEVYVSLTDITQLRVFTDPQFDPGESPVADQMIAATQPMPADPLAWAASLPGITVGTITDTTFGGQPARSLTYRFSDVASAYPCLGSPTARCVTGVYVGGNGSTGVLLPGDDTTVLWQTDDAGTFYEVVLDGHTYFVDVSDLDGAAELAASIVIGS